MRRDLNTQTENVFSSHLNSSIFNCSQECLQTASLVT